MYIGRIRSRMQREQTGGTPQEYSSENIAPGHRIQQWRKFLTHLANLIRFLVAEWKTPKLREKLKDKQLYVSPVR